MEVTHGRNESGSDMIRVNTSSDEVCILANSGLPDLLDNKCEQDFHAIRMLAKALASIRDDMASHDPMGSTEDNNIKAINDLINESIREYVYEEDAEEKDASDERSEKYNRALSLFEQYLSENARVMKYIEVMPHTKQSLAAMDSMLLQGSIAH